VTFCIEANTVRLLSHAKCGPDWWAGGVSTGIPHFKLLAKFSGLLPISSRNIQGVAKNPLKILWYFLSNGSAFHYEILQNY